jgi:RNA polymerase sigma-70 factor (ECF subfamily)
MFVIIMKESRRNHFLRPIWRVLGVLYNENRAIAGEFQRVGDKKLMTDRPDKQLAEAAIKGDGDSFTELCRRYYPAMVAIAHSVIGDRHLAEDAAQQAFATAAVKLPELRDAERFASWLGVICRNSANDIGRKQQRIYGTDELSKVPARQDDPQDTEAVRQAVARLNPEAREVIYLRYYDGLTYERISKVLGISEEAINGRLRRAKGKIAEYLKQSGFSEVEL